MLTAPTTSSPSIGTLGLTVDSVNKRVKMLSDHVFNKNTEIVHYLYNTVKDNPLAIALLNDPIARFTARVIVKANTVAKLNPFPLANGLVVHEEARIRIKGYEIIYIGGNREARFDHAEFEQEKQLAQKYTNLEPTNTDSCYATFCRLTEVTQKDIDELLEMYGLCFDSYLVPLDEELMRSAARNSIFYVARNSDGVIVASAIGESLQLGPLTLVEISEVAAHPILRIRGGATGCVKRVIEESKRTLSGHVVIFMEARMWQNILGMCQTVGLKVFAGILHQHCIISSGDEFTSIPQEKYGSLAICYVP